MIIADFPVGGGCKKELPYNNFMIFSICWLGVSPQKDPEMVLLLRTMLLEHAADQVAHFACDLKVRALGLIRTGIFPAASCGKLQSRSPLMGLAIGLLRQHEHHLSCRPM
ncbi:hypothetical protein [Candidatus Manganitrophus noduliformans]|uniref:Uncharacterized protein n=1 Tax=Candidatus Manganitrophus noduliformans TaxID=2606439 RepID=A0A7X6DPW5_9BACT|nr:hypothetical protein [Candidatus Manganitrophus noduliformans]NKE70893.1 hypothetical protein [Candidatus Manganitrophus noduliformans]